MLELAVCGQSSSTIEGHGFRLDLMDKLINLELRFIRFPEGNSLRNAFHWKETVDAWEDRPGHFGDVWNYWTDDGLGYFEFFQVAEDLGAAPMWVINNGISHTDEIPPFRLAPIVQGMLDSVEFARGEANSTWGSVRASMGHLDPFELKYVSIGNKDCGKRFYRENYLSFYAALRSTYPDIQVISNYDASKDPLNHPAQLYDFHAFVSEYDVTGNDAGKVSLLAALAEAAFLIGVEKNSDLVAMAIYAPLFVNTNDRRTPSYWMRHFFKRSSVATLLSSTLQTNSSSVVASAIS